MPPPSDDSLAVAQVRPARRRRNLARALLLVLLASWAATAVWHTHKPLPEGVHVAGEWYEVPEEHVELIADITAADGYGRVFTSHAIFDEILAIVDAAREFVVLDFFLFNDFAASPDGAQLPLRPLTAELRDSLIARKRLEPGLRILFITDPVNDVYGGQKSPDLARLREVGIDVVITDLERLRDSNFLYSAFWRLALRWWSGSGEGGFLPHPFAEDRPGVGLAAWARLANFKANHRKLVIADDGRGGLVGLVTSANPHDGSSAHSNVALRIQGPALEPLLESELAIARFSGWQGELPRAGNPRSGSIASEPAPRPVPAARVQVLTEGAIERALLERIDAAVAGDSVDIAMFYLSDRHVAESLLAASRRGVRVRLILDPNKDAFGRAKSGIPNRPMATELVAASDGAIRVRWYRTHGEQFHTKLVMVYGPERFWLTAGSANLTRRNLDDYNLEANVAVEVASDSLLALQAREYFETLWSNRAVLGTEYTADFGVYSDPAQSRYWLYRIMESTGLSTF
jgi:hypothetical protein